MTVTLKSVRFGELCGLMYLGCCELFLPSHALNHITLIIFIFFVSVHTDRVQVQAELQT